MSHAATNWAIQQRGLKPATKIVLWHLCDRHNPDMGCFPSLDLLASDCEMSRRSVQNHINILCDLGLVRVEKMPREEGRLPRNRYILGFEQPLGQNLPKAKSALGKSACPPLANSRSRLGQNLPTNPVREPLKEPVSNKRAREVRDILIQFASPEAVSSFIAYQRKMTPKAAKAQAEQLEKIQNMGGDTDEALSMAEERGWMSVQADWYFSAKKTREKNHGNGKRDGDAADFARRAGERWEARFMDSGQDQNALVSLFYPGQPVRIGGGGY